MLLTDHIAEEISFCDVPHVPLDSIELGQRVREARVKRKLGQKHLADATKTSQSYISQLERGEIDEPNVFVIRDLEEALSVYPNYLTEPAETRAAREAAITRLVLEHGAELDIKPEEETELRFRLAVIDPGPNPPMIYLVKVLELVRAMLAMRK